MPGPACTGDGDGGDGKGPLGGSPPHNSVQLHAGNTPEVAAPLRPPHIHRAPPGCALGTAKTQIIVWRQAALVRTWCPPQCPCAIEESGESCPRLRKAGLAYANAPPPPKLLGTGSLPSQLSRVIQCWATCVQEGWGNLQHPRKNRIFYHVYPLQMLATSQGLAVCFSQFIFKCT